MVKPLKNIVKNLLLREQILALKVDITEKGVGGGGKDGNDRVMSLTVYLLTFKTVIVIGDIFKNKDTGLIL